jgi:uncharacterized protein (DUF885 family)
MTEDTNQDDSELFDAGLDSEGGSDSESTTPTGEEIKHTKAETEKEKQISSFLKRVLANEITLDKIPHKWIADEVKSRLPKPEVKPEEIEAKVQEAVQKIEEKKKFDSLREKLNQANLTKDKKTLVEDRYKFYKAKGLSDSDSLETALAVTNVSLENDQQRFAARIPKIANSQADPDALMKESLESGVVPTDVSVDKRIEHWEKLRNMPKN